MEKSRRTASLLAALSFFLFAVGCQTQPASTVNSNQPTGASTPVMSPTPSAADETAAMNMPVTLPVLDALFTDESFAGELKSRLQLTDEQVENLRRVAGEAVGNLRESYTETDYSGSTSAATTRAEEQIKGAIGAEKYPQLTALVRERWSGGGGAGNGASGVANTSGKPNSVPTDTRIVVNAPAYRMDVFENGQLVKTYKIGIGYPEFPLPTGLRKADTIIFNPTWTRPDEPWVDAEKRLKTVEAGSKQNPLGLLKIPIGLPSLIHGGKAPARIGTFASHGCVGLTDPQARNFALTLADICGAELTEAEIKTYAQQRAETQNVKLNNPIPVELRYETIVVEDSKLHIYRDVYDRGTNTEEDLRAVLGAHGVSFEQLTEAERQKALDALEQMARDAQGNPAEGVGTAIMNGNSNRNDNANGNSNGNANASSSPGNANASNKNAKQQSNEAEAPRMTRSIKGQKEIIVEIAALTGKGYPAPINLVNASGQSSGGSGDSKKKESTAPANKRS
ncbi:hypothetical protein BH18ACI2_BH18ACI2_06990 [soil metagenome]